MAGPKQHHPHLTSQRRQRTVWENDSGQGSLAVSSNVSGPSTTDPRTIAPQSEGACATLRFVRDRQSSNC